MKVNNWDIKELEIQNFKSIKNLNIKPGRVNVFIGKPNAGKSNLLEALTLLGLDFSKYTTIPKSLIRYTDIASLFYDQNYDSVISLAIQNIIYQLRPVSRSKFILGIYEFNTIEGGKDEKLLFRAVLDGNTVFAPTPQSPVQLKIESSGKTLPGQFVHIEMDGSIMGSSSSIATVPEITKYQFQGAGSNGDLIDKLSINGNSLWSVIQHNSFLKSFASSFFKEFSLETLYDTRKHKLDIMKRNEDSYYLIDFSMTPDTFQKMLYYLAVIESNKNHVILLEEPEAQSYPPYIQLLAEKIVDDTENQYFITTHSPFIVEKMLEHSGKDGAIKFFVTYFENYQTKVHELTPKEIESVISNSIDLFFNIEAFQK